MNAWLEFARALSPALVAFAGIWLANCTAEPPVSVGSGDA